MFDRFGITAASAAYSYCVSVLKKSECRKARVLHEELKGLEAAHHGKLNMRKKGEKYFFWEYSHGRQRGITKDIDKIYSMARRDYLWLYLSDSREDNFEEWREGLDKLLHSFATAGLELSRITLTEKQYNWALHPQSSKPDRRDGLRYKTANGVLVRSKSEQFIGNMLEAYGIPYRYEPELRIGNRIFHPDFVIMTVDGQKIILEHFGRMDLKEYAAAAIDRLMAYSFHGLALQRDVFVSFEPNVRSREDFMPILYSILAA